MTILVVRLDAPPEFLAVVVEELLKKLPAHMGFGVIELWVSKRGGIERLRHEFFPFYD